MTEEHMNILVDALNDPKQAATHARIRAVLGKHGRATDTAFVDETGEGLGGKTRLELDDQGNTRDVPARPSHVEGRTVQALRPTPAEISADPNRPDDLQDLVPGGRLSRQLSDKMMPPKPKMAPPPEARPGYFKSMGREYPDTNAPVSMAARAINKVRGPVEKAAMVANRFVDASTGGLYSRALSGASDVVGTQIGPSMEEFDRFRSENPTTDNITTFAANVNPYGLAGKVAGKVNKLADPLVAAVRRKAQTAPGKALASVAGAAAPSAVGAGVTGGLEAAVEGADPGEIASRAGRSAVGGAVIGGGMKALVGAGGAVARALRNRSKDLQVLHEKGLEPSPIPGRPVVREDESLMSQLPGGSAPALYPGRVTPATRGQAGREAADEIVPFVREASQANNRRFGELQAERYAAEGKNPAPFQHIVKEIKRRLKEEDLADNTKTALQAVLRKFKPYMPKKMAPPAPASAAGAVPPLPPLPPHIVQMEEMLAKAQGPEVRSNLERAIAQEKGKLPTLMAPPPPAVASAPPTPKPPLPFTAESLDRIRKYTDGKIKKKEVDKGDVQFMQVSKLLRDTLARKDVGPGIAALNKAYSKTKQSFGKQQSLLGMKTAQREPGENVFEAVARTARQRGEETGISGGQTGKHGHKVDRAIATGAPRTLKGTTLPAQPDYKALLDAPRLQLAQENMQAVTSKVFSGAGPAQTTGAGLLARYAGYIPNRLLYPLARRLGEKQVGSGFGADELIRALRQRGEKKRNDGAEQRHEE